MSVAPTFTYRGTSTSRGLISSGEGSTEFYHPLLPVSLVSAAGFLLILNGWNLNRLQADVLGHDGTAATAVTLLQMRAPREAIVPLVSWPGPGGRIFRPGAKYRYRWKDSRTGVCSGLSPIPNPINLGVETPPGGGGYVGVTCWFYIDTTNKPAHADTIELFANTTNESETWYLADSKRAPSATYVLLTDNSTDDELFLNEYVVTGNPSSVPAGPTWLTGTMWPVARAWQDPAGRVRYFGLRRFGLFKAGMLVTFTQGSDLVSINSVSTARRVVEPGRIGQRVKLFDVNGVEDPTVYRLVKCESASTFRIWPEVTTAVLAEGATETNGAFIIQDDRDARFTFLSEPNKPYLIDPLKTMAAGDDYDDGVMAWFALPDGRVFMQTRRRIYQAVNTVTDDPSRSTLFVPIVDEGMSGFDAGCVCPFGWVFFNEIRGVRVFDGNTCRPLDADPDPYADFKPFTQLAGFDPGSYESVIVCYDGEHRKVLVSYVPLGGSTRREVLEFSTPVRVWRGPHRDRIACHGMLRSTTSANVFITGDDFSNLMIRESQSLDVTPTLSGFVGTGTISAVNSVRVFTATGPFNNNSDSRVRGSPIWFHDGTYYYFARVSDVVSSTSIELDGPPVREDGVLGTLAIGMTFGLGSLRWSLVTTYLDAQDDPVRPFEALHLNLRFRRGAASESFEAGWAPNDSGTYVGTAGAAGPTQNVTGKVHAKMRFKGEGACGRLRLRGLSRNAEPQITRAVLQVRYEPEGELA